MILTHKIYNLYKIIVTNSVKNYHKKIYAFYENFNLIVF